MTKIAGGCLCGQVRYTLASPLVVAVCHCTHCQRISGSAFSVNIVVPEGDFEVTGEPAAYTDTGDSGKPLRRHFCARCGSSLFSKAEALPGMAIVKAGTLDDPSQMKPTSELYCDSRVAWLPALPGLQSFARGRH